MRTIFYYIKKPSIYFGISLLAGALFGFLFLKPEVQLTQLANMNRWENFVDIAIHNGILIAIIYVSIIFTNKYAFFSYILNGMNLGLTIGWIIRCDLRLLLLIVPHGIFEIPLILATGYILEKGEEYIRKNFYKFFLMILVHEFLTVGCAAIEAFITPLFIGTT